MSFLKSLKRRFKSLKQSSPARRPERKRCRLGLEALEGRWCPTTASLSGGILDIQGDNAADKVAIIQDDAANTLTVVYQNDGAMRTDVYRSSDITRINIELEGGRDYLDYSLNSNFTRAKDIEVDLGGDNDRAVFNMGQAGVLAGRTIQAQLDITLEGDDGEDQVWLDIGATENASVTIEADLGSNNDILYAGVWGDLRGTTNVLFDLEGGSGNDVLRFAGRRDSLNREYDVDIAAQAILTVNMDGGFGRDLVRANMINEIDGRLNLMLEGGSDSDSGMITEFGKQVAAGVSADVRILAGSTGSLNARVFGNSGNDAMGFKLDNQSAGAASILAALLDGGTGTDTLLAPVSAGVTVVSVP